MTEIQEVKLSALFSGSILREMPQEKVKHSKSQLPLPVLAGFITKEHERRNGKKILLFVCFGGFFKCILS